MRRLDFYADFLPSQGMRWFAVIGFWSGSALWGLSLQRTARDKPFEPYDKQALVVLSDALTETATLSKAVGRAVLTGVTNALGLIGRPALAIDRHAFVLDQNAQADALFDNEIFVSNRRLIIKGQKASSAYKRLIDRLAVTPDAETLTTTPIVIGRTRKRPCVAHVLPVPVAARSPFLGARAVLTFSDLELCCGLKPLLLSQTFGLTPAEARLASLIGAGNSPERAAQELGVSEATTRNQLKAVFNKTNTHRQPELVALLSRLNLG
jgi:DNA-binding CsgD family transcriptional regulator